VTGTSTSVAALLLSWLHGSCCCWCCCSTHNHPHGCAGVVVVLLVEWGRVLAQGKAIMKRMVYTDGPMGNVEVVSGFYPSPAELAFKEDGVESDAGPQREQCRFFESERRPNVGPSTSA